RGEIVPKCLVPILECRRDDADRRTCDDELAEFSGQILLDGVSVHRLHARVNAGENHRLVIAFGREHQLWRGGEGGAAGCQGADEVPAVESPKSAAARTLRLMQWLSGPSPSR